MSEGEPDGPLLLYDGSCGFCADTVQFVLRHDVRARTLKFASLQGTIGTAIRGRHPELASADSVVWLEGIDDSAPLVRSAAALRVMGYLGGAWAALANLGSIVPRGVRDWVYDLVARHRHRLSGDGAKCVIPTEEERGRFLD
jgi:predicted DCC family thiol-disulfide oxidoreductase YuxK